MITLGGIVLSNDMYLRNVLGTQHVNVDQQRTLDGGSHVFVQPNYGGRNFTLGSVLTGGIMGMWCQAKVEEVKDLELLAQPVTLDYRGTIYSVLITGSSSFEPVTHNVLESDTKSYTGQFYLTEV